MAEAIHSQISGDFLECTICLEPFKEPKILPCLHTFCKGCLEKFVGKQGEGKFPCPTCRTETVLPAGGVAGLKNNFFVLSLRDTVQTHKSLVSKEDAKVSCGVCEEHVANHYCVVCAEFLCKNCTRVHRLLKTTRNHEVTGVAERKELLITKTSSSLPTCPKHKYEKLKFYCETCQHPICRDCTVLQHKDHKYVLLTDVVRDVRAKIKYKLATAGPKIEEYRDVAGVINEKQVELNTRSKKAADDIDAAAKEEIKYYSGLVRRKQTELKEKLAAVTAARSKQLSATADSVESTLGCLSSTVDFSQKVVEHGSDFDVMNVYSDVTARLESLLKGPTPDIPDDISYVRFDYRTDRKDREIIFGDIVADEQTTELLERTTMMFTENALQKFRQSKPNQRETELATSAESNLLTKLSCKLGSDWRRLGAALRIPQPRLDSIQARYSNAIQRTCKVMTVWMGGGDHGLPHDLKQLETVLTDMDRADLLDIVKTAYKDFIKEMPEVEVEPEASVDDQGVTTWSVQLPGRGKYVCKQTDLGVVTPCPVQLTYRTVNPSDYWPENEDWELIGPLIHIQCNHDDGVPVELLLPHILDLTQEDGSALTTDDVKAAQVVAGNITLHPADITPTHVITRHMKGSLWASVLQKLRALSANRRGLLTLFKASMTQDAVDVKAHIVSNTMDIVKALQEYMSQLDPKFYWWDSITCQGLRPHQIYCLQATVEGGTLDLADPGPPGGLEYEDTLDCNRIYPSFHMTVQRHPDSERLQLNLQLYPQGEDTNVVCSCKRRLYGGAAAGQITSEDVQLHFHFIKEKVSVYWKDLAFFLGFRRPDIDAIQYKPTNRDAKDCCMDMLEAWRRRRGDAATIQKLLRALTEAGLQDIVDQLNAMKI